MVSWRHVISSWKLNRPQTRIKFNDHHFFSWIMNFITINKKYLKSIINTNLSQKTLLQSMLKVRSLWSFISIILVNVQLNSLSQDIKGDALETHNFVTILIFENKIKINQHQIHIMLMHLSRCVNLNSRDVYRCLTQKFCTWKITENF